jgi:hypothetical protein
MNERACASAAQGGHFGLLRWLREKGCPWDEDTTAAAAKSGNLELLQWIREEGCPWDESACHAAAGAGHLVVLQWLKSMGCPWDTYTCTAAAAEGHLELLQWAVEEGCPWDKQECAHAACCYGAGSLHHLEILKWVMAQGGCRHVGICNLAAQQGNLEHSSGHGAMAAHGTKPSALNLQHRDTTGMYYSGWCQRLAAPWIMQMCALKPPRMATWRCCSG